MRKCVTSRGAALLAALFLLAPANAAAQTAQVTPPQPVLVFAAPEYYEAGGKQMKRYRFQVENYDAYPAEMFAPAPDLPPCGANTKAARTWVEVYDQQGRRLNGFCAFSSPANLNQIWFALEASAVPPSWVYVELHDRKTNVKYKSNLAETVQ
ncbi:MAG TPA: hypothetical protein VEY09_04930 [Pyrinomonadaceae bacterium]|nr:hypothetical protein [Pyrinomonadaceae bacterium]